MRAARPRSRRTEVRPPPAPPPPRRHRCSALGPASWSPQLETCTVRAPANRSREAMQQLRAFACSLPRGECRAFYCAPRTLHEERQPRSSDPAPSRSSGWRHSHSLVPRCRRPRARPSRARASSGAERAHVRERARARVRLQQRQSRRCKSVAIFVAHAALFVIYIISRRSRSR